MKHELVLRGFNGGSDETDHLIVWVESDLDQDEFASWLQAKNLMVGQREGVVIEVHPLTDGCESDFTLPQEHLQFEEHIRALVDVGTMTQAEYQALCNELESRELSAAKGEDSPESDVRMAYLDSLLRAAPWKIDMDSGKVVSTATAIV